MIKILTKFAMDCDEATMLITKAEYTKISLWDRIRLKYHNIVCPPCQEWEDHNKVITALTKKETNHTLSQQKKTEIKKSLKDQ
ncbi:hypothetical protein UJ101_01741 [Flavobacteriaceae bacterium UJ101]|nr:hypothetical protein UJ101_01741 [Flavobacteriaceae bacterium UJ101]